MLSVLALATLGSFVGSLGGAGYDAANSGRRIAALAALHDVATPFAALIVTAIPLALVTIAAVLIAKVRHRGQPTRVCSPVLCRGSAGAAHWRGRCVGS